MNLNSKETDVIEIIKYKEFVTITDFRRVYNSKIAARNCFERFAKVFKVVNLSADGRFMVDHERIKELTIGNTTDTSSVTLIELKSYFDMKEKQLRSELSTLEADPAVIMAKIELINDFRDKFHL